MSTPTWPTVFLSYSHQDAKWLGELRTMLAPLVRDGLMEVWWDGDIKPSERWREEIDKALASARIGVLMVSPNFLASDFISSNELPYLVEAARERGVKLFWVLLAECHHERTPLAEIQAAHDISRPIRKLRPADRAAALKEIGEKIAAAAGDLTPYPPLPSPSLPPGEGGREQPVREAPAGGAGIKPGVSTPGSPPPTLPSPEGAAASARGGRRGAPPPALKTPFPALPRFVGEDAPALSPAGRRLRGF